MSNLLESGHGDEVVFQDKNLEAAVRSALVIAHLSGLMGADVKVTLEIEANIPDGAPEQVVRTVTENSRTLKFEVSGFEEEWSTDSAGFVQ